jgi:hypothetical protein
MGPVVVPEGEYILRLVPYPLFPMDSFGNMIFWPYSTYDRNGQTYTSRDANGKPYVPGGVFDHWGIGSDGTWSPDISTATFDIEGASLVPEPSLTLLLSIGLAAVSVVGLRWKK